MNIIILGAGQVGGSLATNLVTENHEITVVDTNKERLQYLQDRLDIATINGHCTYPDVLNDAGAEQADLIIAVTDSDESNMVACQVAYSLYNVPTKIARIRSPHYFIREELFGHGNLPIDVFISPEKLVTSYIGELIGHPGALQVLDFAEGRIKLVAIKPFYGGALVGKSIAKIPEYLPDVALRVVAIFRNDRAIQLDGDTVIELGDEVFFVTASEYTHMVIAALRRAEPLYQRIIIAGGGTIGNAVAQTLEKDYQVRIIEKSRKRCRQLANNTTNVTVLHADACDKEFLINENIEHADVFCALTDDDEANIIACMQAKRLGVKQVMALIARTAYVDLIEGSSINIAISPQLATVNSILKYLRRGDIINAHSLRRGAAEAIEIVAHGDSSTSKVVGRSIAKIKLPKSAMIGAIARGDEVIIPHADTTIQAEDHVILFVTNKKNISSVEKLFQVSPGFF